jgi:tetratricopeptide (TPR) repeat protein
VGRFYSFDPSANDFAEAIETSAANIKGFRGLSIMMNNAGVAHLIEGDYAGAIEWLERAGKQPAWPLHRFGIEVNLLIAKFLEGENPEPAELLKLARAASRQIDHRYRYQLANILLNLALFAKAHPDCAAEITAILSEPDLLNDPAVTRDHTTLVQLTNRLGLSDHVATAHPGLRGHFIDRHGFVPIFHHAWL